MLLLLQQCLIYFEYDEDIWPGLGPSNGYFQIQIWFKRLWRRVRGLRQVRGTTRHQHARNMRVPSQSFHSSPRPPWPCYNTVTHPSWSPSIPNSIHEYSELKILCAWAGWYVLCNCSVWASYICNWPDNVSTRNRQHTSLWTYETELMISFEGARWRRYVLIKGTHRSPNPQDIRAWPVNGI